MAPPDYAGTASDLRPGGNVVTYADAELRWHVHRDLALAAFVDTGRVWEAWTDIRPEALLWDAGPSASVPSPLGSIRVDAAFRLNRQPIDGSALLALQLWVDQPW
ncbi:MAG: BamA/TamA family outer membrane protein [Deltaproteobacteria bacterium]|nr:BamA/TamA family outer membrane protein [Deltaproteobacteria bacterium]